jgi:uncharacterized membrane protein
MSDTTPRPEDENAPVPPVDGGTPQPPAAPSQPEPPAAPTGAVPPPAAATGGYPPPAAPAGAYPPPAAASTGAYPPPAGGAYPPPPVAPQAPGAYGAPSGTGVDVGTGFSWAWSTFARDWVAFVVGTLLWFVGVGLVWTLVFAVLGGFGRLADSTGSPMLFSTTLGLAGIVAAALSSLITGLFYATFVRAGLKAANGGRVALPDLFDFRDIGPSFILALLFALVSLVVNAIPVLGGLLGIAVFYLAFFSFHFLVDQRLAPVDAVKASVALQTKDWGQSILAVVITWVIAFVGFALCGVGALVGVPVALLFSVYAYRRLTGGTVAPVS